MLATKLGCNVSGRVEKITRSGSWKGVSAVHFRNYMTENDSISSWLVLFTFSSPIKPQKTHRTIIFITSHLPHSALATGQATGSDTDRVASRLPSGSPFHNRRGPSIRGHAQTAQLFSRKRASTKLWKSLFWFRKKSVFPSSWWHKMDSMIQAVTNCPSFNVHEHFRQDKQRKKDKIKRADRCAVSRRRSL